MDLRMTTIDKKILDDLKATLTKNCKASKQTKGKAYILTINGTQLQMRTGKRVWTSPGNAKSALTNQIYEYMGNEYSTDPLTHVTTRKKLYRRAEFDPVQRIYVDIIKEYLPDGFKAGHLTKALIDQGIVKIEEMQ